MTNAARQSGRPIRYEASVKMLPGCLGQICKRRFRYRNNFFKGQNRRENCDLEQQLGMNRCATNTIKAKYSGKGVTPGRTWMHQLIPSKHDLIPRRSYPCPSLPIRVRHCLAGALPAHWPKRRYSIQFRMSETPQASGPGIPALDPTTQDLVETLQKACVELEQQSFSRFPWLHMVRC
jgi:hypothetical protein